MANIKINEIQPAGIELFGDFESFMYELNDEGIAAIFGGDLVPLRDRKGKIVSYIEIAL